MESVGRVVKLSREAISDGMTQNRLAELVGVSPQYINDIERDRRSPSDDTLERIANVLYVPSDYLYFLVGRLPRDIREREIDPTVAVAAFMLLRKEVADAGAQLRHASLHAAAALNQWNQMLPREPEPGNR